MKSDCVTPRKCNGGMIVSSTLSSEILSCGKVHGSASEQAYWRSDSGDDCLQVLL